MFEALMRLINNWFNPAPAAGLAYGFRWVAGAGMPGVLNSYDINGVIAPGVYVIFQVPMLDDNVDYFERGLGGAGTVYPVPGPAAATLTNLIHQLQANPPPTEAAVLAAVTPARLNDISAFLSYTAHCLDIINATPAGTALLNQLSASPFPTLISPPLGTNNQTFASSQGYLNTLAVALRAYTGGGPVPSALLQAAVDARYAGLPAPAARYAQFAADLNALPLCSLFLDQAAFPPNFLNLNFNYLGLPITGPDLQAWIGPGGNPAFDLNARNFAGVVNGVALIEYFLLAILIVLYPNTTPGAGCGAGVKFNVKNTGDNVIGSPDFRPPCIGLAHELTHAYHYGLGTTPGADFGHFTTTAAELLIAGIGPFAAQPVSENAIRGQYAAIAAPGLIDPSNVWALPASRTVYEQPLLPQTPTTLRGLMHCI